MVEPIGAKPTNAVDRTSSPVTPAARAKRPASATAEQDSSAVAATAQSYAKAPPVDAARVAALRSQVKQGSFKVDASAIAERMLAMRSDWMPDDAS